ncbi:MAG: hypothetical protein ACT4O0_09055 [Pseudonocardia sp.]
MDVVPEEVTTHWQYFGRDDSATVDLRAFSIERGGPAEEHRPDRIRARIKKAIDSVLGPEGAPRPLS